MLYQVHLDDLAPENNFYLTQDGALDLGFIQKENLREIGNE